METSPSIFLRPFDLSDAKDILRSAGDDDIMRYLRWASVRTVEEAQQHILLTAILHPWRPFITLLEDGRSIGCVSVRPDTGDSRYRADIGYTVAREFWGRGIATAALRTSVEQSFEVFPEVVRLQTVVEVENKASQKVLEKSGFEKEGLLKKYGFYKGWIRDMFLYSFIKEEMGK